MAARALKAIFIPLRLKILCVVGDAETCVQEIVEAVGTSQTTSHNLAILRDKGRPAQRTPTVSTVSEISGPYS